MDRTAPQGWLLFACLVFIFCTGDVTTAQAAPPRPVKTLILLAPSDLSYDDLRPDGPLRELRTGFAPRGSVGLLNPAVSGEATPEAALLSLGAGEHLAAPDQTGPTVSEGGVDRTVADLAQEAYTVGSREGQSSRDGYARRFGVSLPSPAAVAHLGVPVLFAAQSTPRRTAQIGALGEALKRAGKRVGVYGGWPAALVGMDAEGVAPIGNIYHPLGPTSIAAVLERAPVVIVAVPDKRLLKLYARAALPLAQHGLVDVLIVAAAPPRTEVIAGPWARLGWIIAVGPHFAPGTVLTSPTTRTPGLVANVDFAATVAALQSTSLSAGGSGRPMVCLPVRSVWGTLSRLDHQTTAIAHANTPLMATYGAFAILSCLLALVALYRSNRFWFRIANGGLLTAAAILLTLLPVGWFAPETISRYIAAVFSLAAAVAILAAIAGNKGPCSPLALIFAVLTVVVIGDILCGSPLTKRAIDNFLPGIRFYGIGNEYMGIVLGASLTAFGLLPPVFPRWTIAVLGAALTLLIGLPFFGTNAGGGLASAVAFTVAFFALRGPLRIWHIIAAFAGAFCLVALLAFVDGARSETARSHIGEAVTAARAGGAHPLVEIAVRKLAMNGALFTNGWTLTVLACLVPLWLLLARGPVGKLARDTVAAHTGFARILPAAYWGAFAAFAFNDSGIVAALLLLTCPTVAVLLLCGEKSGLNPSA